MKGQVINYQHAYSIGTQIALEEIKSEQFNAETKKQLYLALLNELETQGISKDQIVAEGHNIIERALQEKKHDETIRFYTDSYYYRIAREAGYSDSVQGHSDNSSVFVRELVGEKAVDRKRLVEFIDDLIEELGKDKNLLYQDYYETEDDSGNTFKVQIKWSNYFDEQESEAFNHIKDSFYQNRKEWSKMVDSRQSILPSMRLPITALAGVVLKKDLANNYYSKVRELYKITPKKLKQYLDDLTNGVLHKSQSDFFHTLKEDAFLWNFLDIRCPVCQTERLQLRIFPDKMPVFVCKNWLVHNSEKTFDLSIYTDRINQLLENRSGSADKYLQSRNIKTTDN